MRDFKKLLRAYEEEGESDVSYQEYPRKVSGKEGISNIRAIKNQKVKSRQYGATIAVVSDMYLKTVSQKS